jgi:hypothetical protein
MYSGRSPGGVLVLSVTSSVLEDRIAAAAPSGVVVATPAARADRRP